MQTEAIELSKIWNRSSSLVCYDSMFVDIMKVLISFPGASDLDYRFKLFPIRRMYIVENTL